MSAGNRVKRFKRLIYVISSNRVVAAFLGNRAVVRGSFSAAMLLFRGGQLFVDGRAPAGLARLAVD
jgi:hypothetical protein